MTVKEETGSKINENKNMVKEVRILGTKKAVMSFITVTVFLLVAMILRNREEEIPFIAHLVSENNILQQGQEMPDLRLYARSALLADAATGRVLYEENADMVLPMASTTKIMTCILALESGRLDEIAEVSSYAASQPKVHAGFARGEHYLLEDLLYSLMLESHNDTAVVIAEHLGGSVEGFAAMMNEKAAELGMCDTYFITPNGLDAADETGIHSTTAYDMARLTAYAIQNEEFVKIINTISYQFRERDGKRTVYLANTNSFLSRMDGAFGVKTGYTADAGYCFVGALERNGERLISVVLGSGWPPNKNYKWYDTQALMNFGLESYECRMVGVKYGEWQIDTGYAEDGMTTAVAKTNEVSLPISEYDEIRTLTLVADSVSGELAAGDIVGCRYLYLNGTVQGQDYVYATEGAEKIQYEDVLYDLLHRFSL